MKSLNFKIKTLYPGTPITVGILSRGRIFTVLVLLFMSIQPLTAQRKRVELVQADVMSYDKARGNVRVVNGNVIFEHEGSLLYCDSALFDETANFVQAFGAVSIRVNDSVSVFGDQLEYDGLTRIADLTGNARLVDNTTTLETPTLRYDRNTHTGTYTQGGVINDRRNRLTSRRGTYFSPDNQFFFRDSVKLHNPDYDMSSDTLHYNTGSEVAQFYGNTVIRSEENTIFCREGWYDTRNDLASFSERASILMEDRVLYGDSIYYDRNLAYGKAYRNIRMVDTERDMVILGGRAIYLEDDGLALVTDSALAIIYGEGDSLFLHADTLRAIFDSTGETQELYCYHHVKFFRTDIQGLTDSLAYIMSDSIIYMHGEPLLWSEAHQMSADTIMLGLRNDAVDQIFLRENSFIASLDDTNSYNQLKGKHMTGYFRDNELRQMDVAGNAETIYYVREEDGRLTGINKAISSDITIRLRDKEIREIVYLRQPEAILYPPSQFPAQERSLEGFHWQGHRRPKRPLDVFYW